MIKNQFMIVGLIAVIGLLTGCNRNSVFDSIGGDIVSLNQAKKIFSKKEDVLWVDARFQEIFNEGHIPKAVNLPAYIFNDTIASFIAKNEKSKRIIVYCSSNECEDSKTVKDKLVQVGYKYARIFKGGYQEWVEKGMEIEK